MKASGPAFRISGAGISNMRLRRKEAKLVRQAIDGWSGEGVLDPETVARLNAHIEEIPFDWRKLAGIAFLIAVLCLAIAAISAFADEALIELISRIITVTGVGKALFCAALAAAFYVWGGRRIKAKSQLRFSNEAILFLGVLATAGAVALLGEQFPSDDPNYTQLVLVATLVYAGVGFALASPLIWLFALLSLAGWLGAETGYASGWGAYYLGMNYPLRFTLFGLILSGVALFVPDLGRRFEELRRPTTAMGLLALFVSLWLMSIFGDYGDLDSWQEVRQIELFHWSLLFAAASGLAIFLGLRRDDGMLRGFGLTFLLINLYTRFFELFWNATHKVVFFAILAASFWLLGRKAEAIWNLGKAKGNPS